ncbi:MAG: superoxide dismutase family protein [Gracilimonas sp.]|uniref:superoxide dismutase family protein n=1 Tax=Gracilimonas sp. TaxID=1974203 RepID=UPI001997678D|nr:superoxide dismutase family protein [Gracilimonas sp.]MBD3616860.1 superoxide dismutase family protein [Gracilimonas sp.]
MKLLTFLTTFFMIVTGCTRTVEKEVIKSNFDHTELVATVMPVGDSNVSGSVTFSESEEGVMVRGNFEGLEPGNHGFHIHEYGDCRAEDGTSAGGHFNPAGNNHGAPSDMERHMGDLGNIEADESGIAAVDYTDATVTLEQILGRGIIIHAGEDDLESQPTGAAGSRVACGVIGIAQN